MKKIVFAFSFIILCSNVYSQDYSRGSVVLKNSDTLIGYLRKAVENELPVLFFKKDSVSNEIRYFPRDIDSFSVNGEVYESHTVIVDKDTISDFFSCKIKGKVSLYSRYDGSLKEHLYLRIENGPLKELIIKKVIVDNPDGSSAGYAEKTYYYYYRVLAEAYVDCPGLVNGKEVIKLNLKSIEKSVVDYHKCVNTPYKVFEANQHYRKKGSIDFGLSFGGMFLSQKYEKTGYHNYSGKIPFSKFISGFDITGHFHYYLPRGNQNKAIQLELAYAKYNFFTWSTFDYTYTNGDKVNYSKDYIHLRALYKNYFWMKNSGLYLGLGVQLGMALSSDYEYVMVKNYIFGNVGYAYNFKKYRVFADVRYSGIMTTSIGIQKKLR